MFSFLPNEHFTKMAQIIYFPLVFILLSEWLTVMVLVSLVIIHHVVCAGCVCVSETGPGPLPAHYSLAVSCVCA